MIRKKKTRERRNDVKPKTQIQMSDLVLSVPKKEDVEEEEEKCVFCLVIE